MTHQKSICIYCGSRPGADPAFTELAKHVGEMLAQRNIHLVYGGGSIGLMGVVARAAMDAGGTVTGVITRQLDELEVGLREVSLRFIEDTMHQRKMRMFELSDGFIALPGGSGTLDEIAEILSWRQLGLHNKPGVLLGHNGFWEPMRALLHQMHDHGFLAAGGRDYFHLAASPEEAIDYIERMIDAGHT